MYGERGVDFTRIHLKTGNGGEFSNPLELVKKSAVETATDSDADKATSSDAPTATSNDTGKATSNDAAEEDEAEWYLVKSDARNVSDFTVDTSFGWYMTGDEFNEAVANAGLERVNDDFDEEPVWMTKEGDFTTKVDFDEIAEYELTEGTRNVNFYAGWFQKASVSASDLDTDSVKAVVPDGYQLEVKDLAERKEAQEIAAILEKNGLSAGEDVATLQMDISLKKVDSNADQSTGTKVGIRIELPYTFAQKITDGKSLAVIHYASGGAKIEKSTYDEETNTVEFSMSSFSPVVLAIVDSELADVLIENVPGGYVVAYQDIDVENEDGRFSGEIRKYVPIGETVKVPVGTRLRMYTSTLGTGVILDGVTIKNGESVTESDYIPSFYEVQEGENTITPSFTKRENGDTEEIVDRWLDVDPWTVPAEEPIMYEGQLSWVVEDASGEFTNVPVTDVKLIQNEWDDSNFFELTSDGKLTSKEPLDIGFYSFEVDTEDGREYIDIVIGTEVNFGINAGHIKGTNHTIRTWCDSAVIRTGVSLSEVLDKIYTTPAMFGGYEFDGWYIGNKKVSANDRITEGYLTAWFKKDGKFYDPELSYLEGTDPSDDDDDPTINYPSSGGGRSSGGSSSSSSFSSDGTIYGKWQEDENGWRFLQTNGSYAANKWGKISGTWYYFGENTYMVTGWFYDGTNWYYLNPISDGTKGAMKIGWLYDTSCGRWFYLNESGAMVTGWQFIDSNYYYFNPVSDGTCGAMVTNQWVDGYFINADGIRSNG